jgi:hypothetical protein
MVVIKNRCGPGVAPEAAAVIGDDSSAGSAGSHDKVYGAHPIKRVRATKAEMASRLDALVAIVAEIMPCSVRQVFYQATVHGLIEKSEDGYTKVQRALVDLRRSGALGYDAITDSTRWQRKQRSYNSPADALRQTARLYRKDLWADADSYVEIWIEKDALAGVIYDVTTDYDVPLMSARGFASLSFLYGAAEYISELEVPAYIYHLGDFDPSGVAAAAKIKQTLGEMAPDAEIHFERLAVLPEQIDMWRLPGRPTKASDSRAKNFGYAESVELDAMSPDILRRLVKVVIEQHLPADRLRLLRVAEESEREILRAFAARAA